MENPDRRKFLSDSAATMAVAATGFFSASSSATPTVDGTVVSESNARQVNLREKVNIFDFMSAAQIADIQAHTLSLDCAAAINAAIRACFPGGKAIFFPRGMYLVASTINIHSIYNLSLEGEGGTQNTNYSNTVLNFTGKSGTALFDLIETPGISICNLRLITTKATLGIYLHGGISQNRFLQFDNLSIEGFSRGIAVGDNSLEGNVTYCFDVKITRTFFRDCIFPIICDSSGFDGIYLSQLWVSDPNNRTLKGFTIPNLQTGNVIADNVYMNLGTVATHGWYMGGSNQCHIRNSRVEAQAGTASYIGFWESNSTPSNGSIFENFAVATPQGAGAVAMVLGNNRGATFISGYFEGDIQVGAGVQVVSINPRFLTGCTFATNPLAVTHITGGGIRSSNIGNIESLNQFIVGNSSNTKGYAAHAVGGGVVSLMRLNGSDMNTINCNSKRLAFENPLTNTSVGAAGSASPLPARPAGYLCISVDGGNTVVKVPYYNN